METSHIYDTRKHLRCSAVLLLNTCIIDKLHIMRMVSLQELFIKTLQEVENLDDSVEIRGFYLKQKLKARYPLLQFLKPIQRNSSEIVFCKEDSSLLADKWMSQSDLEKLESTDCEYDSAVNIIRESSLTHQL